MWPKTMLTRVDVRIRGALHKRTKDFVLALSVKCDEKLRQRAIFFLNAEGDNFHNFMDRNKRSIVTTLSVGSGECELQFKFVEYGET